jgi:hypothetical protein
MANMGSELSIPSVNTGSLRSVQVVVPGGSERRMLLERDVLFPARDGAEADGNRLFPVAQRLQASLDDELLAR